MKFRKLFQRMAAALVAGAMTLSLCAPALAAQAEVPDTTGCDFAVGVDSGDGSTTWTKVTGPTRNILGDESGIAYEMA